MPETRKGSLSERSNNQMVALEDIKRIVDDSRDAILKSLKDELSLLRNKVESIECRIIPCSRKDCKCVWMLIPR